MENKYKMELEEFSAPLSVCVGAHMHLELLYRPPRDTVGEEMDTHNTRKRKLGVNTLLSANAVGMLSCPLSRLILLLRSKKWKLKTSANTVLLMMFS